jgi:hypothetical protein
MCLTKLRHAGSIQDVIAGEHVKSITPMNFSDLIADLTYTNYALNRAAAPNIIPERWRKVYGPELDSLEAQYQAELLAKQAIRKAAA